MTPTNPSPSESSSPGAGSAPAVRGLAVVVLCGVVAWLVFGLREAGGEVAPVAQVADYLGFAATAPVPAVVATFDEGVKGRCDPQLLAMLVKALPERFGALTGVRSEGFTSSDGVVNGRRRRAYDGDMLFQRGMVPLDIAFVDGKLVSFLIKNDDLARGILATRGLPLDLTPYRALGERFWRAAMGGKPDEAYVLLSEPLRKSLGPEGFAARCLDLSAKGAITSLAYLRAVPHAQEKDRVHLLYRITAERGGALGHVTFQFAGVNSHLIAFQLPSSLAPPDPTPGSAAAGAGTTAPAVVPGAGY